MEVEVPPTESTETLVDLWMSLAEGQRQYGAHICAAENRTQIREAIVRHLVSDRLFAAIEDDVLGFVMFRTETESYEQDVSRGIVENLFVRPERRSEGIGTQLLAVAERELARRNVDVIALEAMSDNATARRFYRDRGYEPHRIEFEKPAETK